MKWVVKKPVLVNGEEEQESSGSEGASSSGGDSLGNASASDTEHEQHLCYTLYH